MAEEQASRKAAELIAKADKKLTSWFASLSGSKYEDAEELYSKAANQLKVAKQCVRAAAFTPPLGSVDIFLLPAAAERARVASDGLCCACAPVQGKRLVRPSRRRRSAT